MEWKRNLYSAWRRRYVECMPDVGRVLLLPEDSMVIMASDGLWDVLSDQQAVDAAEVRPLRHGQRARCTWCSSTVVATIAELLAEVCSWHRCIMYALYRKRSETKWQERAM